MPYSELTRRYPEDLPEYLIDEEGHVYTPLQGGRSWRRTDETEPVAASMLQNVMMEAERQNLIVRPAPWADTTGHALYYDPRVVQPIVNPTFTSPVIPKMNGLASAARIFGFLSILFSPFAIIALICGYAALGQIRERGERGRNEAMTGIGIGWVIVGLYILVLTLIAFH